ncbi:MAG: hypothetical protein D6723_16860 [Acidobacteria bacterium]|nr:MAG: hypothetical protein D6723_16860 [Acidobacteriota bacterium]
MESRVRSVHPFKRRRRFGSRDDCATPTFAHLPATDIRHHYLFSEDDERSPAPHRGSPILFRIDSTQMNFRPLACWTPCTHSLLIQLYIVRRVTWATSAARRTDTCSVARPQDGQ